MQEAVQSKVESPTQSARQKQQVILDVLAGRRTATDAAAALGISRKSYYQWQDRAMAGMLDALQEQSPGRPVNQKDPAQEALERANATLRKENLVLAGRLRIQNTIRQVIDEMLGKKPRAKKKG